MFNSDYQINKDFDINNLFLNLTFHKPTEEFEFKEPLLDHPSNYQMIVTKFFSKVNFPLLILNESKKNPRAALQENDKFLYDYYIRIDYDTKMDKERYGVDFGTKMIIRNLFTNMREKLDVWNLEPDLKTKVDESSAMYHKIRYLIDERLEYHYHAIEEDDDDDDDDGDDDDEHDEDDDGYDDDDTDPTQKEVYYERKQVPLYWYHDLDYTTIFSPQQFIDILNTSLADTIKTVFEKMIANKDFDGELADIAEQIGDTPCYFFTIENSRLCLWIHEEMRKLSANTFFFSSANATRYMRIAFSHNLRRFLKGFPTDTLYTSEENDSEGFFYISLSSLFLLSCRDEYKTFGNTTTKYFVVEGEKISFAEWGDYIGIAVSSTDFPVVGQVYPHFYYDPSSLDNRKRFISEHEKNITGFANPWADQTKITVLAPEEEDVQEQYKKSVKSNIIFVKYFDQKDKLNHINYENNNANTTLKLDIERTMPLQKFNMTLWLIDRYNNFEILNLEKYPSEEVVKMQILLQRIKGDEKENRMFIDAIEMPGTEVRPLIEPEEEEDIPIEEPEPEKDKDVVLVPVPAEEEETEPSPEPPEIEDMEDNDEDIILLNDEDEEEEQENELY